MNYYLAKHHQIRWMNFCLKQLVWFFKDLQTVYGCHFKNWPIFSTYWRTPGLSFQLVSLYFLLKWWYQKHVNILAIQFRVPFLCQHSMDSLNLSLFWQFFLLFLLLWQDVQSHWHYHRSLAHPHLWAGVVSSIFPLNFVQSQII